MPGSAAVSTATAIAAIDADLRDVMRVAEGDGLRGRGANAGDVIRSHSPTDRAKNSDPANADCREHQPKNGIGAAAKEMRHMKRPFGSPSP